MSTFDPVGPQGRRLRAKAPTPEGQPSADQSLAVVPYQQHQSDEPSAVADFATPQERFSSWDDIFEAISTEFVNRSREEGVTNEHLASPAAYSEMVAQVVAANPTWNIGGRTAELVDLLRRYQFGYWGLENYLSMDGLEEIYFNDFSHGFYIANGDKNPIVEPIFSSNKELESFIKRIATENGLQINMSRPAIDAKLKDGSRVHASLPPIAVNGAKLVIRKHRDIPFEIDQYIESQMITRDLADDLQRMVAGGWTMIVSGGTASGKTSFLNAILSAFLPAGDRILLVEDTSELKIRVKDLVALQAQRDTSRDTGDAAEITISDLIRFALRMRPDRIIVGEVRGSESFDALKAWNSGHDGSMCTLHADSPELALSRFAQLVSQTGQMSREAALDSMASGVQVILQVSRRVRGAEGRRVTSVVQILHPLLLDLEDDENRERYESLKATGKIRMVEGIETLSLYRFNRRTGTLDHLEKPLQLLGKELD